MIGAQLLAGWMGLLGTSQEPAPPEKPVRGGITVEHLLVLEGRSACSHPGYDVVVATLRSVSAPAATHGTPPRVELEIHELLRGDPGADRTRAIWLPFPHDIDAVGGGAEARLAAWSARPLATPAAGTKMILAGRVGHLSRAFEISAAGRFAFSPEQRERALAEIRESDRLQRRAEEEKAAARKALEEGRARWRASAAAKDIADWAERADFVGIGTIVSQTGHPGFWTFEIREILKGARQIEYPDGRYYADVPVPPSLKPLLENRERACVVFLSEKGLKIVNHCPRYARIDAGDGLVLADEEAVRAAREGAARARR